MRRAVLMVGLATLAALVPSLSASAGNSGTAPEPGPQVSGPAPASGVPFSMGGTPCSLIPVPASEDTPPVGSGTCRGVRPGGRVVTEVGGCTFNFLFRAPDGTRFIGTAGHCIGTGPVWPREKVWPRGTGPVAEDADGKRVGEFAYAVLDAEKPKDFALIRLDPGVEASPEMCHFGGPRGVYTTDTADPVVLQYYGNAVGVRDVLPARSGVALGTPHPHHVYAAGLAVPGDSGSGVMTADGLAVGVLVTTGLHGVAIRIPPDEDAPAPDLPRPNEKGVDLGTMGITRLAPQVARASQEMGVPLELVTVG
jgi:hypothetical protein